jgi:hypothetical protein
MTQLPTRGPTVEVQPQPNVYTILLIVAIAALLVACGMVLWKLMSQLPVGYAMQIGQMFEPFKPPVP